jgi:hypothetical protein
MALDRAYVELNRASTERMRARAARLSPAEMQHPVGEHWTVGIVMAHLAFWERRVLDVLNRTEAAGKLTVPEMDIAVNDLSLPLWAAIPPDTAARLAIAASEAVDRRLESYPEPLLEEIYSRNRRWVVRAMHRNEHLDEVDAALAMHQASGDN